MKKILLMFSALLFFLFCLLNRNMNDEHYYRNSISVNYNRNNITGNYSFSVNPTMNKYFRNLKSCMGNNLNGSCAYVALSMLLSYYDTFYNDDTIPENYEYQITPSSMDTLVDESPGILPEPTITGNSIADYTSFINSHSSSYFQSYLISLCMNAPIKYYNMYNVINGTNDLNMVFALDRGCAQNILQFYINSRYLYNYYSVIGEVMDENSNDNSDVLQFIKHRLDCGFPVIVGTENIFGEGHMQVVHSYHYNSYNGKYTFFANLGYVGNQYSTDCYIDEDNIVEACTLYTPIGAQGSNNYGLFVDDENLGFNLTQYDLNMVSNSRNLWYNYFRYTSEIDLNYLTIDNINLGPITINSVSCYMTKPQYIFIATNESYDTTFYGTNVNGYNCFLYIGEDINGNEEDDYYDPDAWAAFSVTDRISFIFESSFYIYSPYRYFIIEVTDYLYNY